MATTALNSWKAIQNRNEALTSDKKFKPDKLTPLCSKLDTLGEQLEKQKEEKEKAGKVIDDAEKDFEACQKKIDTQLDEIERTSEQLGEIGSEADFNGDDAVKNLAKVSALYLNKIDEITDAAQGVVKACGELSTLIKKTTAAFKAKREAVDAAVKKIQADGTKTQGEIKKQVGVYQKIATDMKDRDMAGDIGSLNSIVLQLYSFS